ncbi:ABC transporter permease [Celeribacter sp.]|uniref:ABC transporter permease n=1 Tax=Celeribacter sp. TaxID=1890673 RepID=UPI003A8F3375
MDYTPRPPQKPQPIKGIKGPRVVAALVMREVGTSYGRTPGGYIWALIEPMAAITLFTIVLSVGLRLKSPSIGNNFMLFYATGYLPYALYLQTNRKVARSLKYSRRLLAYPRVTFVDAILARFLLVLGTNVIVIAILMTGIYVAFDLAPILDFSRILLAIGLAAILGLGTGVLNCFLMSRFAIWETVWVIITRPLLFVSTVLYAYEDIPWRFRDLLAYNPIVHMVGAMRSGFYPIYDAAYVNPGYVVAIALICMVYGFVLLHRWNQDIVANL